MAATEVNARGAAGGGGAEGPRPLPLHLSSRRLREPGHRPPRDRRGGREPPRQDDPARARSRRSIRGPESTSRSPTRTSPIRATTGSTSGARSDSRTGPDTWEDLRVGGRKIKEKFGNPVGHRPLARRWTPTWRCARCSGPSAAPSRTSRAASSSTREETVEALKFMRALYKETETPEVFTWDPASNNRMMLAGRASFVRNAISVTRTAEKREPGAREEDRPGAGAEGAGAAHRRRARHELLRHLEVRREHRRRQAVPGRPRRRFRRRSSGRASSTTSRATRSTVPDLSERLANDPKADPKGKYARARGRPRLGDERRLPGLRDRRDRRGLQHLRHPDDVRPRRARRGRRPRRPRRRRRGRSSGSSRSGRTARRGAASS